jgi:hypothetical protein
VLYLKPAVSNLPEIMNKLTYPGADKPKLILKFIKLRIANLLLFH